MKRSPGGSRVAIADTWPRHRQYLTTWIETEPPPRAARPASSTDRVFSLKVRARAVDVIAQLAAAAGKTVWWDPRIVDRQDRLIELDEKDTPLQNLVENRCPADWRPCDLGRDNPPAAQPLSNVSISRGQKTSGIGVPPVVRGHAGGTQADHRRDAYATLKPQNFPRITR